MGIHISDRIGLEKDAQRGLGKEKKKRKHKREIAWVRKYAVYFE